MLSQQWKSVQLGEIFLCRSHSFFLLFFMRYGLHYLVPSLPCASSRSSSNSTTQGTVVSPGCKITRKWHDFLVAQFGRFLAFPSGIFGDGLERTESTVKLIGSRHLWGWFFTWWELLTQDCVMKTWFKSPTQLTKKQLKRNNMMHFWQPPLLGLKLMSLGHHVIKSASIVLDSCGMNKGILKSSFL